VRVGDISLSNSLASASVSITSLVGDSEGFIRILSPEAQLSWIQSQCSTQTFCKVLLKRPAAAVACCPSANCQPGPARQSAHRAHAAPLEELIPARPGIDPICESYNPPSSSSSSISSGRQTPSPSCVCASANCYPLGSIPLPSPGHQQPLSRRKVAAVRESGASRPAPAPDTQRRSLTLRTAQAPGSVAAALAGPLRTLCLTHTHTHSRQSGAGQGRPGSPGAGALYPEAEGMGVAGGERSVSLSLSLSV